MQGERRGECRTCGEHGVGMTFREWVRDTFTDHDKLKPGDIICNACQFCFTDQNDALAAQLGKPGTQRTRNYSHFVVGGLWVPLSKGDKTRMREMLYSSPDVAIIATSGQKHIIFRAQPGWWQIEEARSRPFPDQLRKLLVEVEALYHGGISKTEIESGRYNHKRIMDFGLDGWRHHESAIKPARGSLLLQLAVFLAQRPDEDEENDGTSADSGQPALAGVEGNTGRVQGQVRPKHLAAVRGQHKKRGVHIESSTLF